MHVIGTDDLLHPGTCIRTGTHTEDRHAERPGDSRAGPADSSQSHHGQCAARGAQRVVHPPHALLLLIVIAEEMARHRDQSGDGELRHAFVLDSGGIADADLVRIPGHEVVDAGARCVNELQRRLTEEGFARKSPRIEAFRIGDMRIDPGRIGQTVVVVGCRDLKPGKPPVKLGDHNLGIFCKNENAMLS